MHLRTCWLLLQNAWSCLQLSKMHTTKLDTVIVQQIRTNCKNSTVQYVFFFLSSFIGSVVLLSTPSCRLARRNWYSDAQMNELTGIWEFGHHHSKLELSFLSPAQTQFCSLGLNLWGRGRERGRREEERKRGGRGREGRGKGREKGLGYAHSPHAYVVKHTLIIPSFTNVWWRFPRSDWYRCVPFDPMWIVRWNTLEYLLTINSPFKSTTVNQFVEHCVQNTL